MPVDIPLIRTLDPPEPGDQVVSISVSPAGAAVVAWASAADHAGLWARDTAPSGASFPRPRPDAPVPLRVTLDVPDARWRTWSGLCPVAFPTVHVLPGDHILIVGARARWRPEGPERNAFVYTPDGQLVRSACVGDGIQHVATTGRGAIWVGYFDEGVFGNLGWGGPGPAPIGASGLNRFDADLNHAWSFPGDICDCYALTLSGEVCLVCPYTDWAVSRVSARGVVEAFRNTVAGATTIVESGLRIALVGGYGADHDRVVVGTLRPGGLRVERTGRLALPGASPTVIGRDGVLHAFADGAWHAIALDALIAALPR